jgi:Kef-type K+ transport system membrane component KefB
MTQLTKARIAARISTKKTIHLNTTRSPCGYNVAPGPKPDRPYLGARPNPPYNGDAVYTAFALVVLAGLLGPLLADGKRPRIPVLVGELIGGIVLGRTGLHVIDPGAQPFPAVASLGFAMLMLESGIEIDIASRMVRDTAVRAGLAFLGTLLVAIPAGLLISRWVGSPHASLYIVLLAGSSAAVALPTIREQGLNGPAIALVIAWIGIADAVTALLMPLTLTGSGQIPVALLGDALIILAAALVIALGRRYFGTGLAQQAQRLSKERHWALRLRLSVLMLLVLGAIAEHTGASLLVAGFAAGIVLRQFRQPHRLALELTGLATGFFVPAFFVLLGATLDLKGLASSPSAIALALAMAVGATIVHAVAALVTGRQQRLASGLLASVQLGLPAAAAALGLATSALRPPIAAALVAGGLLTLIPAIAGASRLSGTASAAPPEQA